MAQDAPAASVVAAGLKGALPALRPGRAVPQRPGAARASASAAGSSYAFADSGDGPAVFAIFILGFLVLGGALLVEFKLQPAGVGARRAVGLLTPLLAFFLLRVLKATLIALQYKHKAERRPPRPRIERTPHAGAG